MNIQRGSYVHPTVSFCTGTKYSGEWNEFGISGSGVFTFQNGELFLYVLPLISFNPIY